MSMIFCESLLGIIPSRLLALRLSCRITLYGLPSPMEAIWAFRIRNTHFRWCLSVKIMTGLAGGVISFIVVVTMFAYVLYFTVIFEFFLFLCNGIFPHREEGGMCLMKVLAWEGNLYIAIRLHDSLCESGQLGRTRNR